MRFSVSLFSCAVAIGAVAGTMGQPAGTTHIAANWGNDQIQYLDVNLNNLGGFPTGASAPNGTAFDGTYLYSGHFSTQEVRAFDLNGNFQFSWNAAISGLQGMEYVNSTGELAIYNAGVDLVEFYNPANGNFIRSVAGQGINIEGLAWDGSYLWRLDGQAIYATDVNNGNVLFSIPNPAANEPFSGTALNAPSATELVVGTASGNWWRLDSSNGNVLGSGNNSIQMFGLSYIPEPASLVLLVAGAVVMFRRR